MQQPQTDKKWTVEEYAEKDTAGTYRKTESDAVTKVDSNQLAQQLAELHNNGYIILEDVFSPEELTEFRAAVSPFLNYKGRNSFEGELTQRVYSLVSKTEVTNRIAEHPQILALLDKLFNPEYLLSQLQAINLLPGETTQPLHFDDAWYHYPRPRKAVGAATIVAIDDFTADNGGTVLIPQSHEWGDHSPTPEDRAKLINCEMKAGSVLFFLGTLWHGGGSNTTDHPRLAITAQYCEGFCRPMENFTLSVTPETVATYSENMKRMLGYSVFGPFMGMVDGKHPKRLLEPYLNSGS